MLNKPDLACKCADKNQAWSTLSTLSIRFFLGCTISKHWVLLKPCLLCTNISKRHFQSLAATRRKYICLDLPSFLKLNKKSFHSMPCTLFYYLHFHVKRKKCSTDACRNWECGQHCSIDKVLHTIQKMCSQPGLLYVWQETVRMTDEDLRARIER